MKRILSFKHWKTLSTKQYRKLRNTTKTISIIGASRKLGVTHLSLCLANFLHSALKQPVIYIEVSDESKLLELVGEKQIFIDDMIGFLYKGVTYILACDAEEAMKLLNNSRAYIILDIQKYSGKTSELFDRCEKRIVIGSMKPWCKRDYFELLQDLKGGKGMYSGKENRIKFYNIGKSKSEKTLFSKISNCSIESMPVIENPFSLKEEDFEPLLNMIM